MTAVHLAAQNGHTDVVSLLLSRSAGLLRIADKHGRTPLHLSASHGHYDMSLLLIGQGADIDAYDKVPTLRLLNNNTLSHSKHSPTNRAQCQYF